MTVSGNSPAMPWLASCLQDLKHGVVLLSRDAAVSGLIVGVLALGIGGTAAIFTLLKAAFLDPLPYCDAARLVTIVKNNGWAPSVSEFLEIQARSRTLEQFAFAEHTDMQLSGVNEPVRVFAARVTASFFPLLGVNAASVQMQGRTFVAEENQAGRTPAVVLSDGFWRSRMGADPKAVGRTMANLPWSSACSRRGSISTTRLCAFRSRWTSTSRIRSSPQRLFNPAQSGPIVCSPGCARVSQKRRQNPNCEASDKL
jgi:hypothetical protein